MTTTLRLLPIRCTNVCEHDYIPGTTGSGGDSEPGGGWLPPKTYRHEETDNAKQISHLGHLNVCGELGRKGFGQGQMRPVHKS